MGIPLLSEIVIILACSVFTILVFQKLKLPAILGFLMTGALIGPSALGFIQATHEVELLAEIGVIFLLFVIGIEFSLKSLVAIRKTVIGGGILQVGGTILLTALISYTLGLAWNQAIFIGFLLSLSSTAIVLKVLHRNGEITSPHGRVAVGILIFQDIIVVPMMLLTPILAGQANNIPMTLFLMVLKFALVLGIIIILARYVVPYLLTQVVKTRSNELFMMTILVLCFATAWLTSSVGLSLALGAFFAGLVISESDYHHQATAIVLPFREIFVSFFFVSIGMLLDLSFVIQHLPAILIFTLGVILIKCLILALTVAILRYHARTIIMSTLMLFQVGEFAFILSATGMQYHVLTREVYQYFLAICIVTMAMTPFVISSASRISNWLLQRTLPERVRERLNAINKKRQLTEVKDQTGQQLKDHLVIIGYGINGQNLAKAAKQAGISYVIVELNPDSIEEAKKEGEPIFFGDATHETILQHLHVSEARVVVIAISDPLATKLIITKVRSLTHNAYLIVRTRFIKEIPETLQLGADEIIPEEFETSIEIFNRVLKKYLIPNDEIQLFTQQIRSQNYELFRLPTKQITPVLHLPNMEISTLTVQQGNNRIVGKSIAESNLRQEFEINILAIKRGREFITQITAEEMIFPDDILYVFGAIDKIQALDKYLLL